MLSFQQAALDFEQFLNRPSLFPEEPRNLYDPCYYLLQAGGKRIRPAVCLMAAEMFGPLTEDAYHAAMAIELFHNFTLIHDDIMDESPLRRGQPTVHIKYGLTAGILSGDVLGIYAYQSLSKIQSPLLSEILKIFNRTAIEVCEGQQRDMDFEKMAKVTLDEYLYMIQLKTAVLLACSLQIGALIGGASPEDAQRLYQFGINIGMAFQLQDDYLDAFGIESKTGKRAGGDIRSNKKTALLIHSQSFADDMDRAVIDRLLLSNEEAKVSEMQGIYLKIGSDKYCNDIVNQFDESAHKTLAAISIADERRQPLRDLANYLLLREH